MPTIGVWYSETPSGRHTSVTSPSASLQRSFLFCNTQESSRSLHLAVRGYSRLLRHHFHNVHKCGLPSYVFLSEISEHSCPSGNQISWSSLIFVLVLWIFFHFILFYSLTQTGPVKHFCAFVACCSIGWVLPFLMIFATEIAVFIVFYWWWRVFNVFYSVYFWPLLHSQSPWIVQHVARACEQFSSIHLTVVCRSYHLAVSFPPICLFPRLFHF